MRKFSAILMIFLLASTSVCLEGWAQPRTPDDELLQMSDLFVARPLGVAAGIVGTGLFIISLPFTIPTKSVDKAAKELITDPFHFSFSRQFPDESLDFK